MCLCSNILVCPTKLFTAVSPSKFYRFLGRKRSEITAFFKTSKQLFQRRFYLSVSPDCKMCVRVTNTGENTENIRIKTLWFNNENNSGNIYTEILSYSSLLQRAKIRNKMFIDKLESREE